MTTAIIVGGIATVAIWLGLLWFMWRKADHSGYVRGINETLEKEITNAKKSTKVEESVAMLSDADVTRKLSKYKRPF